MSAQVFSGKVKFFRDSFGFITMDNGKDVFCHYKNIIPTNEGEFRTLKKDQNVTFEIVQTDKGPAAANVRVV